MSTKTTTTQTSANVYNPASMGAYNSLQPGIAQNLREGMSQDKLSNLRLNQLMQGVNVMGLADVQNIMRNARYGGFGGAGLSPYLMSQLGRSSRARSRNAANAQIQNLLLSEQLKQYYTQLAMGYNPLETGRTATSVQKKSGLGTWLPQVAGVAASIFAPMIAPGIQGLMGGGAAASAGGGSAWNAGLFDPVTRNSSAAQDLYRNPFSGKSPSLSLFG